MPSRGRRSAGRLLSYVGRRAASSSRLARQRVICAAASISTCGSASSKTVTATAVAGCACSGGAGIAGTAGAANSGAANPSLNVTTLGDYSYGMLLQSIGGGGGNGGDVFDFSVIIPAVGVGGDGGSGGDGGTAQVNLPNQGAANGTYSVATAGDNAHGLFVQSIGGGGGVGGDVSGTDIGVLSVQIAGGADSDPSDDADGAERGKPKRVIKSDDRLRLCTAPDVPLTRHVASSLCMSAASWPELSYADGSTSHAMSETANDDPGGTSMTSWLTIRLRSRASSAWRWPRTNS